MMGHDLMRPDAARHGALVMTDAALPILRGETRLALRRDARTATGTRAPARALVSEDDAPLLSALKAKRRALAEAQGVPAYVVFTDRTLIEMAERKPHSLDAMAGIVGVGAKKLDRYGAEFLEIILGAPAPRAHPQRRKMSGQPAGVLFDGLQETCRDLQRGACGTLKPLSCSTGLLRRIAEQRPATPDALARIHGMDADRLERFGAGFLALLKGTGSLDMDR
jgi:ATP-dependent DNA helicase RecQ